MPPVISIILEAGVVTSCASQTQPVVAAGNVIVPVDAAQAVPTLIVKAALPLLAGTAGVVQKPETVGAVVLATRLVSVRLVAFTAAGVVTPIEVLLIVLAAVGLMVSAPTGLIATVPVPVGEIATAALAGESVTAPEAVRVVNAPVLAVVEPIGPGTANVALLDEINRHCDDAAT